MMLVYLLNDDIKRYASILAKKADCTYSHTIRILQEFDRYGLVTLKKSGRQKMIALTKKGKDVAVNLRSLIHSLD